MKRSTNEPAAGNSPLALATAAIGLLASLGLGYLALSQRPPATPATAGPLPDTQAVLAPCVMDRDGYWQGRLFAATALEVDVRGEQLDCAGNARPNGKGLRLFFATSPAGNDDRLLLVIGIASGLDGLAGQEHPVSVTLIDEASKQFFHSPGERCFTKILQVVPLPDVPGTYRIDGELYCVGAIAALGADTSVTIGDTVFSGRLALNDE